MPHIENDIKLDFRDVLLRPKRSTLKSRSDVDLVRSFKFRNSKAQYRGIPVIAANMDTVGTFEMAKTLAKHGLFTTIHKHYSVDDWKEFVTQNPEIIGVIDQYASEYGKRAREWVLLNDRLMIPDRMGYPSVINLSIRKIIQHRKDFRKTNNVAVSAGSGQADFEKLCAVLEALPSVHFICLDVANGYSEHFVAFVRQVRKAFPSHTIMAGNVVTGEMVEELILSGADIIKVGIGPGSVCTTRKKTGVGYPQLSAVIECADAAHGLGGHIISDGGCTCPGDVAKAFGAGADFVMLGGMLAGHDQAGGEVIERQGKKFKLFYGMSSSTAMKMYHGGVAEYRASEGKTVEVPYRGDVEVTVQDVLGGIRSACTYIGAAKLKELPRRTTFIRVAQQGNEVFQQEAN